MGSKISHHTEGLCLFDRCNPNTDIPEDFCKNSAQTKGNTRTKLEVTFETYHQFPLSTHHLLNQHGKSLCLILICYFSVGGHGFPLVSNIHVYKTTFCLVAYMGATNLYCKRKPDLNKGIFKTFPVMSLPFLRNWNAIGSQDPF